MLGDAVGKAQLAQNRVHVLLDSAFGDDEFSGDTDVGEPLRHER